MHDTLINLLQILPEVGAVLLVYVTTAWLIALAQQDNSIVDITWGPGIFLTALVGFLLAGGSGLVQLVILGMVLVWSARLAGMIAVKNAGRDEDARYAAWRKGWGKQAWWRSYLQVFLLQGLLMVLIALTPLAVAVSPLELRPGWFEGIGLAIFLLGLCFESVGDYQLYRFKRRGRNHGKLLTKGLWRYTRHPNYFGEAAVWVGIGLAAYPTIGGWALVAPLIVVYLVRFLSGVPIAERHYAGRTDFERYAKRTNVFVPLPPRR